MIEEGILNNGIQVIHQQNTYSKVGHIGVFINVGSRDEEKGEEGLAHYLEHVIFKGTKKRKAFHVLSRLDSVGGELNAYTTKEETCVYASFPIEYLSRALELLSDIIFNSNFPNQELQKEKEVVVEEINSYKDSPTDLIFDEFDKQLFKGHSLGNDILGTELQVKSIKRSDVLNFVKKYYIPERMVISSIGSYPLKKLINYLEKYFEIKSTKIESQKRSLPKLVFPKDKIVKRDVHQTHTMIGGRGYSADHPSKNSLLLLNNLLGGPAMNSRLNLSIREKYGFTYMLESNCTIYSDCGSFSVYFASDPKNTFRVEKLIQKEFLKLCNQSLGTIQLSQAKKQVKGQLVISMENNLGVMLANGKSKLLFDKVDNLDKVLSEFEKITSTELLEVANEIMHPKKLFKLTFQSK
ncbi:MAG: peptidase M16 [Flavobacteriales bacterium]|nr:peptidase M16 [Flavobacteriales bacterium]|tara:strand:+ start:25 stop:1251 length:1227 start_codon:yes stop_codon:yes gene_type:complete